MSNAKPNFREESKIRKMGYKYIAGVDEAGRGAIAGKITAAAVIFPAQNKKSKIPEAAPILSGRYGVGKNQKFLSAINDSKKLAPAQREKLYKILTATKEIKWAAASVSAKTIDKIGIHKANQLAMRRAVEKLRPWPDFVMFDGRKFSNNRFREYGEKFIVKADEKVMSCAAASIIAKVTRDRAMLRLHKKYSRYGFDKHKGYGTKLHFRMLKMYGPCEIHRRSFEPVKSFKKECFLLSYSRSKNFWRLTS